MITSVLALASNEAWLTNSVQNFVAAHRSYGDIPPDAYARLLDVLVDTLAQVAGSRWTDEFETAWRWYVSGMKDRKRVVEGKSVSVRVHLGCRRYVKKKHMS